ncbi:hypothetical protein GF359_02435, partial [candidate division WOR-3 bacterium]|nr:hypothetical protein [candidate division WOR-3 bacterium]MBD3364052.1 hypothetical protein [candidate division WOR-3 bacterium]
AVAGAFMIIGLEYGITNVDDELSTEKAYDLVKEFSKRFKELHGSIVCRDLIGCDISTEQGIKHARDNCLFEECPNYVDTAARIVEGLLDRRKPRSSC